MAGTRIEGLKLTKVVDGDTIKVEINGQEESLRLCSLDTEESRPRRLTENRLIGLFSRKKFEIILKDKRL